VASTFFFGGGFGSTLVFANCSAAFSASALKTYLNKSSNVRNSLTSLFSELFVRADVFLSSVGVYVRYALSSFSFTLKDPRLVLFDKEKSFDPPNS